MAKKNRTRKERWNLSKRWEIIWYYVKEYGYDDTYIASLIDASRQYVRERRISYQNRHNISDEKFKLIKAQARLKRNQKAAKEENYKRQILEDFLKVKELYLLQYKESLPRKKTEKKYFNLFIEISNLEIYTFTKEDIDLLRFTVLYEEEYLTDENIKYIMEKYLNLGENQEAMRLLNSYINYDGILKTGENIDKMRLMLQSYLK